MKGTICVPCLLLLQIAICIFGLCDRVESEDLLLHALCNMTFGVLQRSNSLLFYLAGSGKLFVVVRNKGKSKSYVDINLPNYLKKPLLQFEVPGQKADKVWISISLTKFLYFILHLISN